MAVNPDGMASEFTDEEITRIGFGKPVFDSDGNRLGKVRGFDHGGFYVTMREGYEAMSVEHARSGAEFSEAELMWRCMECGRWGASRTASPRDVRTAASRARR